MRVRTVLAWVTWACAGAVSAQGQDTVIVRGRDAPPPGFPVEQWAVEFFNRPSTTRFIGDDRVSIDTDIDGDVAVYDGRLTVRGRIDGTLVAINADVDIRAGARVEGNILVLGGELTDDAGADIDGTMRRDSRSASVRLRDGRLVLTARSRREPTRRRRPVFRSYGRSSIVFGSENTYNRVEGLPLRGGLRFVWGWDGFESRLRGYGVFRTAGDFETTRNDMGYNVDWSFRIGHSRGVTLVARAYDLVVPTQSSPLEINEVGWATLLWHRDYRDYFLQRGYSGTLAIEPVRDLTFAGRISKVEEASIAARSPWTPFRANEPWRPNPGVDEGDFTVVAASATLDTRPSGRSRRSGWYARGEWERWTGEDVMQRPLPTEVRAMLPADSYVSERAAMDLRRYQSVGRRGQLRFRAHWAGSVAGDPLNVQRRYSIGGPDQLIGYRFRAFACNQALDDPALPGLCDNVALLQAEYRGSLSFDFFDDRSDQYDRGRRRFDDDPVEWFDNWWFDGPTLVLFSNAGTGWLDGDDMGSLNVDVGGGLEFGGVGFYVAKALGDDQPVRFTMRAERRF